MSLDPEIDKILTQVGNEIGLPKEVWYPIAMLESGGDPSARAVSDTEDSRGIFQVNILAHPDANSVALYDPEYNARYQMPELKRIYDQGVDLGVVGSDLPVYVEKYGQRPAWSDSIDQSIRNFYDEFTGGSSTSSGSTSDSFSIPQLPFDPLNPLTWFPSLATNIIPKTTEATKAVTDVYNATNVKGYIAYGGLYIFIFVILLFSFYMIFINKTFVEDISKDAAKTAIKTAAIL